MIKNDRFLSTVCISLLLILSIIQIFPSDVKIIREASASSTWEDSNWSAPENYSASEDIDIIPSSGELNLRNGRALYVADVNNHRIVKTTMDGSQWTTYGTQGTGVGQFNGPGGIRCDSSGFIYVADQKNHRIVKTKMNGLGWTTYGTLGTGMGQFNAPVKLFYDNCTDSIYVADYNNHRIVKTMMNGSGWTTYGSFGIGKGQFNGPGGIDYDSNTGYIYMVDYGNHRIVKTMMNGSGWTTYGSLGNGTGQFSYPDEIYYDSNTSHIYVADQGNHRIVKTMMNGSGWTTYGTYGSGTGQFTYPRGIHYDRDSEYIYVVDIFNHRIVKTMMNGSGWTTYGTKGSGIGQFNLPDGITLSESSYFPNGYLISKKYDFGSPADFLTLSWVADTLQDTNVKFQLRSATNQSALLNKDFMGPNGNTNTYYNKTNVNIWNGHNGDIWAQYKVYLNTSNLSRTPVLKNVKIVYNLLPNQPILISPSDNAWTNDNTTTFSWQLNDTDSSAQNAFQWQADNDKEFNHIDYDTNIINSLQSSHTLTASLPDGLWYWRVRTKDNDGGWGPFCLPWKIIIDTTVPSSIITIPINDRFYNNLDYISGFAYEPINGTGIDNVEITIKDLNKDRFWNGFSWVLEKIWLSTNGTKKWSYNSSSITWTSGFQYHIQSRAIDNATNIEIPSISKIFTFDIDNVVFSNTKPLFNDVSLTQEVEVGITISDTISGVNASTIQYAISYDNGSTWDSWVSVKGLNNQVNINVTQNLNFPNGSDNRIKWRACDVAGNGPTESIPYQINVNTWQEEIITPKVRLWSPQNGSIIRSTSTELSWMLNNSGLSGVTYNVIVDDVYPPVDVKQSNLYTTNFMLTELQDEKTYYWTIVPKLNKNTGSCISGIWSFTVDIIRLKPSVTLISPANGSEVQALRPTFVWMVNYDGTEELSYNVFLGKNEPLEIEILGYDDISYLSKNILEYNETYYWKVVSKAGGLPGIESEIWSFTIRPKDYIPTFGIEIFLEPSIIEIKPGETKFVNATVTNKGEIADKIVLSIPELPIPGLDIEIKEPKIVQVEPSDTAVFNITIKAKEDAKEDVVFIKIVAASSNAAGYNQIVEEQATLFVKISGSGKHDAGRSTGISEYWVLLIIIIVIIITLLFVGLILKKKQESKEEPPQEEVTAPETEPELELKPDQVVEEPQTSQFTPTPAPTTTPTTEPTESESKPLDTSMPSQVPIPQIPEAPEQLQLPPADNEIKKKEIVEESDEKTVRPNGQPTESTNNEINDQTEIQTVPCPVCQNEVQVNTNSCPNCKTELNW